MSTDRELMAEIEGLLAGEGVSLPDSNSPDGVAAPGRPLPAPRDDHEGIDPPRAARDRAVRLRAGLQATREELTESNDDGDEMELLAALDAATDAYFAALPRVDLARCPFTGATATMAVDTYGLDGPWWNYLAALRPLEPRPATLVAVTGALRLDGGVERTRHLAKPGPGVPYVLPRLMAIEGVRAIIRAVPVGAHLGWAITYFAERFPADVPRANDWGADHYPVADGWDTLPEGSDECDFDLAPWIARGRLAWIAPGDASLAPHTEVEGCPYTDLAGERSIQRVEGDAVWTDAALPGA